MTFRRDRSFRDIPEERFPPERTLLYPRSAAAERRPAAFGRPDDEYGRGFEYDGPRFYPNGAPRSYHGEDQRGYHGDGLHFVNEHRGGPPARRDDYPYFRGPRDEPHTARQMDFRTSSRTGPPPGVRVQGSYPPPRPLSSMGPDPGDDTVMQAILSLDRGEDRDALRRKGTFPPLRDRSPPPRRDVPPSPHSRSGSSVSSRGYSPERGKAHSYQPPQSKRYEEPYGPSRAQERDRQPGPSVSASRDGSPHSSVSASKDEGPVIDGPPDEALPVPEEASSVMDDFHERRAQAIAAKAREIEKVYRQDCETFGMVVKMLVAKEPSLEKHLQAPLRENLSEIRERCLDDLRHFISELDEVVRQPEPSI
ncbi:periphilin-1 [Chanos chanos]|uniref:Periphilin-1 n=1 Tax=Chanos chanos TaxID=29144 RepID=A0A6J2W2Q5_CHACN|nr:periphilin-1-like [Chanos chanos]